MCRRRPLLLLALVAAATGHAAPALAQGSLAAAERALDEGRYADADRLAAGGGGAALAIRARVLAAQGKVAPAIALLEPAKASPGTDGRRARLALAELLLQSGRRGDAEPLLRSFADDYNNDVITSRDAEGLAMVGRAMHLLRHPKDAVEAFKSSVRVDPARAETHLWWAELFAENFDPGDAEAELQQVVKLEPRSAAARALLAKLKVDDAFDFAAADKLAAEALAIDPRSTGALAVRAGIALRDGDLDAAKETLDAGLAMNPADLELLSLRAASRFLADDRPGFEAAKAAIFARDKEFSRAYGIIGEYAEWEHRYDDVIGMMKDAVALDPRDGKAWAELGIWQTRSGDEKAGVASLESWWKLDHFDVRAFNTLEKLYTHWIPEGYESAPAGIFDVRYPKAERPVLERYVPRMLGEAWGQMKAHYMFAPKVPVHIEMYRTREHFSVRTSGLPSVGIQGVCFGRVVAAMSPASEPFNWGNVLWHELGHVFAIQLSKNHVPRWFTEGLSEYETLVRRPEWQRELDPQLYSALRKGHLPGAVDMNRAFTHADGNLDVTVAYYAASQMIAFTAEQFGFPKITRALELWGQGKPTAAVITEAFGVSPKDYDQRFRAWAGARLSRYAGQYMFDLDPLEIDEARAALRATPAKADAHVALGFALLRAQKVDDGRREIEEALRLEPANRDAHFLAAKLSVKDPPAREAHLRAILASGSDGYAVEEALADAAQARHDAAGARAALEAAHRFDPTQVDVLHALYDLAVEDKRDPDALEALRGIALLDQHDRQAWAMLLERLVESKRWEEAKRVGESALFVDVERQGIHVDYARALAATGDHVGASFELESALLCEGKPPSMAEAHALLARERAALGDAPGARSHRDQALKLDPENADAKSLKI